MEWITHDFLNGLGVVGLSVLVMLMVTFGKGLALQREVRDRDQTIVQKNQTIEWLQQSNDAKDRIIADLANGTRVTTESLRKVSVAAERLAGGEEA